MSDETRYLGAWGAAVLAIAAMGRLAFDLDRLPAGLLGGAGLAAALVGLGAGVAERRRPRAVLARRGEPAPGVSAGATTATVGLVVALVGVGVIGQALTWPGIGLLLVGLHLVGAERRQARRRVADAEGARRRVGRERGAGR